MSLPIACGRDESTEAFAAEVEGLEANHRLGYLRGTDALVLEVFV